MSKGNRPCRTFRGPGGVQLAVWKNRSAKSGSEWFSTKLSRSYKVKDEATGEETWKSTDFLGIRDLPVANLLIAQAVAEFGISVDGRGAAAQANTVGGGDDSPDESSKDGGGGETKAPF